MSITAPLQKGTSELATTLDPCLHNNYLIQNIFGLGVVSIPARITSILVKTHVRYLTIDAWAGPIAIKEVQLSKQSDAVFDAITMLTSSDIQLCTFVALTFRWIPQP